MLSVKLANPIPLALRSSTTSMRCLRERPKRSSRHTTRVSPGRSCSRALSRPGRDARAPLALSVKMRSQPAFSKASVCKSNVCSSRLTRAYPIFTVLKMSRNSLTLEYHETRVERRVKRHKKRAFEDYATKRGRVSYKRPLRRHSTRRLWRVGTPQYDISDSFLLLPRRNKFQKVLQVLKRLGRLVTD